MRSTGDLTTLLHDRGPDAFGELIKRERHSVRVTLNQPLFVPGLFQTPAYATEMISRTVALKPDDPELAERVNVRMQRATAFSERLHGANPPHVSLITDEATLRRMVGGREAMRQQLGHLRAMSELPTVELGIVPLEYGAHVGLIGSFEVHEDSVGDTCVFFESAYADDLLTDNDVAADRYRKIAGNLMSSARSGVEAQSLLETISSGL